MGRPAGPQREAAQLQRHADEVREWLSTRCGATTTLNTGAAIEGLSVGRDFDGTPHDGAQVTFACMGDPMHRDSRPLTVVGGSPRPATSPHWWALGSLRVEWW